MTPKDRDEFLQEWEQPELLLHHLTSAASYGASDLAVLWARLETVSVAAFAVLGGCVWLFAAASGGSGTWRWITLAPLVAAAAFVVLCFFQLLRAAQPLHQSEPHRLQLLRDGWIQSRQQLERSPHREDAALRAFMVRTEKTLVLANWVNVVDDFARANKAKLTYANAATRHLFRAVAFLVASVVTWCILFPIQLRGDEVPELRRAVTMPQDANEPPVVHPPTEVTERDNPSPSPLLSLDPPTVHPPTEVTEKGVPSGRLTRK